MKPKLLYLWCFSRQHSWYSGRVGHAGTRWPVSWWGKVPSQLALFFAFWQFGMGNDFLSSFASYSSDQPQQEEQSQPEV